MMNPNTSSSKHITTLIFGVASLSVGLSTGCPKDKYYYDATGGKGYPDMSADAQPDLATADCERASDCPARQNTEATCTSQGTCEYACTQGWGDPEGKINAQGCTCDTSIGSCKLEATCGDGFKEGQEQCDNGTQNSDEAPDACRTSCKDPSCGDKVQDAGEACDDGNQDNTDACTTQCTPCGNGKLDEGEVCDDGNFADGDGCSATCQVEDLWACDETTSPSTCWEEWSPPANRPFMKGFGITADLLGDVAVVGAPLDETYAVSSGTVHIYERRNGKWTYAQELRPDEDLQENAGFGARLILTSEGDLIIAAPSNNSGTQAIYIYQKQGVIWQKKERLVASELGISGRFISGDIAYHNNYLVTSEPNANNNQGIVHIFKRNNPNLKFTHDFSIDGAAKQKLGTDLAIINTAQRQLVAHTTNRYSDTFPKPYILATDLKTKMLVILHSFQDNESKYGDSGICTFTENTLTFTKNYKYQHDAAVDLTDLNVFDYYGSKERTQLITPWDLSGEDALNNLIKPIPSLNLYTITAICRNDHMAIYTPNGNDKNGLIQTYKLTGNIWSQISNNVLLPKNPNTSELERLTHYAITDGNHTLVAMPKYGLNAVVSESKVFPIKN